MQERAEPSRIGISGLAIVTLVVAVAGVASVGGADDFIKVDSLDDTFGADEDGMRTFRWALNEANTNGDSTNIITFDFDFAAADEADGQTDNTIQIELTLTPTEILESTSELTIGVQGFAYFFDIVRTDANGNAGLAFLARENLTLNNVTLRSSAIVGNRVDTDSSNGTVDLVYDIDGFVLDILGEVKEFYFENPAGDSARLVKKGSGELALLSERVDPNAYTGGTLLVDGVLRTDSKSLQGDVQICADMTLDGYESAACDAALLIFEMPSVAFEDPRPTSGDPDDSPPVNGTYAGNITSIGNGKVLKTGTGSLTLTGNNTYTGGTYILQGELIGDTSAIQGDVHICPTDSIFKPDTPASNPLDCIGNPQLTFDITTDSNFTGTLNGTGHVQKIGDAKLGFDFAQTNFDGTLQVGRGELELDVALGSTGKEVEVTVNSGATLSGIGTVTGDVTVDAGGVIVGGLTLTNDLTLRGTLDITLNELESFDVTLDDDSVVATRLLAGTAPGKLVATNQITADDFVVDVDFDDDFSDGLLIGDKTYITLAEATKAFLGTTGGSFSSNNAIFDLTLAYNNRLNCSGAFNICITATFNPVLVDDAITSNQIQVAGALDQARLCADNPASCGISTSVADDFLGLYGNFAVDSEEIPKILDRLAGEEYAALADIRSAGAARFNRSISRRFDLEFTVDPGDDSRPSKDNESQATAGDVSAAGPTWKLLDANARNNTDYRNTRKAWRRQQRSARPEPMPSARHGGRGGFTGWLDIHGVMGEISGSKNADNIDYRIYGPLFGLDYGVSDHITLGVTLGFTRNEMNTPGTTAKGTGNTYQGGAYVGAIFEDFHLIGSARYAYSDFATRRQIRFNALDRTATADFDARDTSAFFEAAYHLQFRDDVIIQPMLSVAYNHLDQSSFNENNAGSLNLEIDKQVFDVMQSSVGVRIAILGRDDEDRYLLPQFRLAYEREWLDKDRSVSAHLLSAGPNGAYQVKGIALPRDRAVIGVSSEVGVSDRINLFADYDLRAAKDLVEHSLAFGLRAIW